jgi:peptidoglycan/LPS O-acetylase OafA/YrhL
MTSLASTELPTARGEAFHGGSTPEAGGRLLLIDSFRALAALMVFGYHITPQLTGLPLQMLGYGWLGVQVFFAISGFVIARSVGRSRMTPSYVCNFIFRRSVRLDPPYWMVIASVLILLVASNALVIDGPPAPAWDAVAAHVFYLQNILGYGDIVDVFWSLCIEVQFYLAFVVILGTAQSLSAHVGSLCGWGRGAAMTVFGTMAVLSLAATPWFGLPPRVWLLTYWNQFFVGALAAWILQRRVAPGWFVGYASVLVTSALLLTGNVEDLTALITAVVILVAGERGWLHDGLNWSGLQGLGRISYSFYLVHTLTLARLTRMAVRVGVAAPISSVLIVSVGFGASIVWAWLLYQVAESPCVRLSKRFKPAIG